MAKKNITDKTARKNARKEARKEARRQIDLNRQARAKEKKETKKETKTRCETSTFVIDENEHGITMQEICEKLTRPYDVWGAVYTTSDGETIPYLFLADYKTPQRTRYMSIHRKEIYQFIDETWQIVKKKPLEEKLAVLVYTNPGNGHAYGISYCTFEDYVKFGEICGMGDEAAAYAFCANLGGCVVINCAA